MPKGTNKGSWHSTRKRKAKGFGRSNNGYSSSPRIAVSLDEIDFANIRWLAEQKGKPVSAIVRDAIFAYLLPFRTNPALKLYPPKK